MKNTQVKTLSEMHASTGNLKALESVSRAQRLMAEAFSLLTEAEEHLKDERDFPSMSAEVYRKQIVRALNEVKEQKKSL